MARPPKYKTVEEFQAIVDEYFEENKDKVLTVTGLVLHLGFSGRTSFYDYERKKEFTYAVRRARTRIEHSYELMLHKDKCTGAIFALKNFGWTDRIETDITSGGKELPTPIINVFKNDGDKQTIEAEEKD